MVYWRRTLYTIWFTQFIAIAGFSFVGPFIPYYIQTLGVTDTGAVALWTGLCSSASAITLAIMGPVWGALSDRYGRKVMILRATLLGSVVLTLMGLVTSVYQLLGLRLLQGAFTGTIAASTTLIAGIVPDDHRGAALGSLQTAIYLGTTLGPLMGGVFGDAFGYSHSFFVTGALLLLSGLLVLIFVREHFHPAEDALGQRRPGYRQAFGFLLAGGAALVALLAARVLLRAGMMIPTTTMALFVQSLLPGGQHAALVTGVISGSMAIGGAVGAPLIGSWGDRWGYRPMLMASGLLGVLAFVPQAFAPGAGWLIAFQFLAGVAEGGTLATTMALLAGVSRGGHEGTVFGLDSSATGLAASLGPLLGSGVAAALSLRAPFILAAAILAAGVVVVMKWVRPADDTGGPAAAALPRHNWRMARPSLPHFGHWPPRLGAILSGRFRRHPHTPDLRQPTPRIPSDQLEPVAETVDCRDDAGA